MAVVFLVKGGFIELVVRIGFFDGDILYSREFLRRKRVFNFCVWKLII